MVDKKVKSTQELIDALVEARNKEEKSQTAVGAPFYNRSQISKLENANSLPALDKVFHILGKLKIQVILRKQNSKNNVS